MNVLAELQKQIISMVDCGDKIVITIQKKHRFLASFKSTLEREVGGRMVEVVYIDDAGEERSDFQEKLDAILTTDCFLKDVMSEMDGEILTAEMWTKK